MRVSHDQWAVDALPASRPTLQWQPTYASPRLYNNAPERTGCFTRAWRPMTSWCNIAFGDFAAQASHPACLGWARA